MATVKITINKYDYYYSDENKNIKNGKLGKYLTIPIWTNLRIVKIDSCKMY